jgi:hypothetical protein
MMQNITAPFEFSIEIESLYIAHVFPNINKKRIAQLFEKLNLARISGIDFVSKIGKDGKPYNSAYIHIDYWFDNVSARHFQEKIRSDAKESLLVYDDPWYWIVNENVSPRKQFFIQKTEEEENQMEVEEENQMEENQMEENQMEENQMEENQMEDKPRKLILLERTTDTKMEIEDLYDGEDNSYYQDEEEYQFLEYEALCQEMEVDVESEFADAIQKAWDIDVINDNGNETMKLLLQADKRVTSLLSENKRLKQELRKIISGY